MSSCPTLVGEDGLISSIPLLSIQAAGHCIITQAVPLSLLSVPPDIHRLKTDLFCFSCLSICSVRVAHSCVVMDVGRRGGGKGGTDRALKWGTPCAGLCSSVGQRAECPGLRAERGLGWLSSFKPEVIVQNEQEQQQRSTSAGCSAPSASLCSTSTGRSFPPVSGKGTVSLSTACSSLQLYQSTLETGQ